MRAEAPRVETPETASQEVAVLERGRKEHEYTMTDVALDKFEFVYIACLKWSREHTWITCAEFSIRYDSMCSGPASGVSEPVLYLDVRHPRTIDPKPSHH